MKEKRLKPPEFMIVHEIQTENLAVVIQGLNKEAGKEIKFNVFEGMGTKFQWEPSSGILMHFEIDSGKLLRPYEN